MGKRWGKIIGMVEGLESAVKNQWTTSYKSLEIAKGLVNRYEYQMRKWENYTVSIKIEKLQEAVKLGNKICQTVEGVLQIRSMIETTDLAIEKATNK